MYVTNIIVWSFFMFILTNSRLVILKTVKFLVSQIVWTVREEQYNIGMYVHTDKQAGFPRLSAWTRLIKWICLIVVLKLKVW